MYSDIERYFAVGCNTGVCGIAGAACCIAVRRIGKSVDTYYAVGIFQYILDRSNARRSRDSTEISEISNNY